MCKQANALHVLFASRTVIRQQPYITLQYVLRTMKMRKYWPGNVQRFIWMCCIEGRVWIFYRPRKANSSQYPRDTTVLPALTLTFKSKNVSKSYHQTANIIIRHSKIVFVCTSVLFFLGTCTKLRKVTTRFVMSVCLSVLLEQFGSHWADFRETSNIFRKYVAKISLKSEKYNTHFTGIPR